MLYQEGDNYRLYLDDCLHAIRQLPAHSVDMVFADPPYKLSNDGITCKSGKMASVNKGSWDKPAGLHEDYSFTKRWLRLLGRVLKPNGTIWISGTYHIIYSVGHAVQELDYHIINDICWFKRNAPPNMACRCFTASHETLLWVKLNRAAKHTFNYDLMRSLNNGKQMRTVWDITAPSKAEKVYGSHPTQKPLTLLKYCILASTNEGDAVLDPFCGSGTTGVAALQLGRRFIGVELEKEFIELTARRIEAEAAVRRLPGL